MEAKVTERKKTFEKAFPEETLLIAQFIGGGGAHKLSKGVLVSREDLKDSTYLDIVKLERSTGATITNDEAKAKAFPFIYDTKSEKDICKRRDTLYEKLTSVFSGYNVTVYLFKPGWAANVAGKHKALIWFINDYGDHDILVTLT